MNVGKKTKQTIEEGVELTVEIKSDGSVGNITNNLPGVQDGGGIAHVRPHATKRAYLLEDGTRIGNIERDGDELPDGRVMTQQSFWLNSSYVYEVITFDDAD